MRAPPLARGQGSLARSPIPIIRPAGCASQLTGPGCEVADCTPSAPSADGWRITPLSLKSLCGGGVPSSHPSLGLSIFFLSFFYVDLRAVASVFVRRPSLLEILLFICLLRRL